MIEYIAREILHHPSWRFQLVYGFYGIFFNIYAYILE